MSDKRAAIPLPQEKRQSFVERVIYCAFYLVPLYVLLTSKKYRDITIVNGILQTVIFLFISHIPGQRTGRLSYVDIAWSWGVLVIGALTLAMGTGWSVRKYAVSSIYLLHGGRMGIGVINWWFQGRFDQEFGRYEYRKLVWKYQKIEDTTFEFHVEIFKQLYLNIAFFIVPAVFCGYNTSTEIHPAEAIGYILAILAWVVEFYADEYKGSFIRA